MPKPIMALPDFSISTLCQNGNLSSILENVIIFYFLQMWVTHSYVYITEACRKGPRSEAGADQNHQIPMFYWHLCIRYKARRHSSTTSAQDRL